MHYIFIENGKINGGGKYAQEIENGFCVEVSDELFSDFEKNPLKYVFKDGQVVVNEKYEELLARNERKRLDSLSLTAADVERAIYKNKRMDFEDVIAFIEQWIATAAPRNDGGGEGVQTSEIDIKALKIELKANNFYRGNPYINQIGALLEYTSAQLDYLFEHGEFEEC